MKKSFLFLISITMILIFSSICIFAEGETTSYSIDEAGITINLPSDFVVFTRNTSSSNTDISDYLGMTYESLMATFEAQNIFLEAVDPDITVAIAIISEESDEKNLAQCTDEEIGRIADEEEQILIDEGNNIIDSDVYKTASGCFVETKTKDEDSFSEIQYMTVAGERKIKIRITSYDGEISDDASNMFKEVINSVEFDKTTQVVAPPSEEPAPESTPDKITQPTPDEPGVEVDTPEVKETAEKTEKGFFDSIPAYVPYIIIAVLVIVILVILTSKKK